MSIGEVTNKFGQEIGILEYRLTRSKTRKQSVYEKRATTLTLGLAYPVQFRGGPIADYWLFYVKDKVVRVEGAGDLEIVTKELYDTKF